MTEHKGPISDLQASADRTMVITASKDNLAKVGGAFVVLDLMHPVALVIRLGDT